MNLHHWLIKQVAKQFPQAIFFKETTDRVVALTIDDSVALNSTGGGTQIILEAIGQHNQTVAAADAVRATFFPLTHTLDPDLIPSLERQGHEIGNHGVIDRPHAKLSAIEFEIEFHSAHQTLSVATSKPIRWYRPSWGVYTQPMLRVLAQTPGYEPRPVLASLLPLDTHSPSHHPSVTQWYVQRSVFPGVILVLHDGTPGRSQRTAIVLRVLLPWLHERGYRVVTLSRLWDEG